MIRFFITQLIYYERVKLKLFFYFVIFYNYSMRVLLGFSCYTFLFVFSRQLIAAVPPNKLELYVMESCPYCQKVDQALHELGVTITIKNISKSAEYRNELARIGEKQQVPCLVIHNHTLYESEAIIAWLKTNFNELYQSQ